MIKIKWALSSFLVAILLLTTSQYSYSAGFSIIEQSVSGLGNAFAGGSAASEDATVVYYNPAGMMHLSGKPLAAGVHAIQPSIKFKDKGSDVTSGGDGGEAGQTGIVPNFYYVMDVGDNTKFGIGINAPFGLATEYDKGWQGRYHAVKSEVSSININPAIAFNVMPALSVGLGLSFQYFDAELTNAVDIGSVCAGAEAAGQLPANTCTGVGLTPRNQNGNSDGFAIVTGDSWAMGYNFGLLYTIDKSTNIGFAYRSKVKQSLGGDADFTLPTAAQFAPLTFVFADTPVTANITLPETASLSASHSFNRQWQIMGDITMTKWSRFQDLKLEFNNPNKESTTEEYKWENTLRYSLGADFSPVPSWKIRAGLAYDQGAAPNATYRSPRVPDSDRTWIALGLGYTINQNVSFDLGYVHLIISDADINRTSVTQDTLTGTFESAVDIVSGQLNWIF